MKKLTFTDATNLHSQWGEEAAIRQILDELGSDVAHRLGSVWVEFGASEGSDNSNFWAFKDEYRLVLIEPDPKRFSRLSKMTREFQNVLIMKRWVGFEHGLNDLSTILRQANVELNNVLGVSIDIDSDDAAVFEAIAFRPMFVIVEFNPLLPSDGRFRNPSGANMGNSLAELVHVGLAKGMFPAALSPTNIIFLSEDLRGRIQEINVPSEVAKLDLPRFGWGYDGTLVRFSTGGLDSTAEVYHNGWSHSFIFQPAPKSLRGYKQGIFKWIPMILVNLLSGLAATGLGSIPKLVSTFHHRKKSDRLGF